MKSLMLKIAKKFIPGADKLAQLAAAELRRRSNTVLLPCKETAQKWGEYASTVIKTADKLADMARDGYIDEEEEKVVAKMLEPVFAKLLEVL